MRGRWVGRAREVNFGPGLRRGDGPSAPPLVNVAATLRRALATLSHRRGDIESRPGDI